jgi:ribonuclease HII
MGKGAKAVRPSWRYERNARQQGFECIAGIDEAGRGPLAGPVVAAAVVFPSSVRIHGLNDSKLLAPEVRAVLAERIRARALAIGVGMATASEIDRINIHAATLLAARRAVDAMGVVPDYLITDYLRPKWARIPVEPLVRGDQLSASVAAASIIAKTTRDALMRRYEDEYPGYGFASHKGYTCPGHLDALGRLGPSTIHRLTFRGVAWFDVPLRHSTTFARLAEAIEAIDGEPAVRLVRQAFDGADPILPECERDRLATLLSAHLLKLGMTGP